MEPIIGLLTTLNALTPVGVLGLSLVIIYLLVKGKTSTDKKVDAIRGNDLHELVEMAEMLRRMEGTLQRLEVKLSEDLAWLKARVNGVKH